MLSWSRRRSRPQVAAWAGPRPTHTYSHPLLDESHKDKDNNHLIFLPFCLFVFLSKSIFNSSCLFILVHPSSLKFGWKPSEACVLSFCLPVFSSFCPDLSLIIWLSSYSFILVHWNSLSTSMLHLSKVPIDGAHVTDICYISWCSTLWIYMLIVFVVMYSFEVWTSDIL